jgi:hypothetical protein
MTQAAVVRRDGDTFQARMFWLRAARLLDPAGPIVRVGFEVGPKSFDDIWVEYDPSRAPRNQCGDLLRRDHIQCKWHVAPNSFSHSDLTDPQFINASSKSFLQRARAAQISHASDEKGVRFKLLTNWRVHTNDPLREMINNRSGAIRLERLFGSKTDDSAAGAVRKCWREHLEFEDSELGPFASTLSFVEASGTLDDIRERLDDLFLGVALRRIPSNESAFLYDDLAFQWLAQGRLEFDRAEFRARCSSEGLLGQGKAAPRVYGVKSFEHPIDQIEDRCHEVLNLVPSFHDRFIRSDDDWSVKLYPELSMFLLAAAKNDLQLRLVLDAHSTLAFAAGSIINVKSGRKVELEQRSPLRRTWSADDLPEDTQWSTFDETLEKLSPTGTELAVAIGVTHDISGDVRRYCESKLTEAGCLLTLQLRPPGAQSLACGHHAFRLADAACIAIRKAKANGAEVVHLFVSAPNVFTFFLGQHQKALGGVQLYEFDFDGAKDRTYRLSLSLPVKK